MSTAPPTKIFVKKPAMHSVSPHSFTPVVVRHLDYVEDTLWHAGTSVDGFIDNRPRVDLACHGWRYLADMFDRVYDATQPVTCLACLGLRRP